MHVQRDGGHGEIHYLEIRDPMLSPYPLNIPRLAPTWPCPGAHSSQVYNLPHCSSHHADKKSPGLRPIGALDPQLYSLLLITTP